MTSPLQIAHFLLLSHLIRDVSSMQVLLTPSENKIVQALGKGIVITCEVTNLYNTHGLNIQWFNARREEIPDVTQNARVHTEQSGSANKRKLYVSNIQLRDAGKYFCVATASGQSRESYFELTLFKAITFDDAPLFQHPSIYRDAHIKCQVSGEPEPVVSWKYNDTIPISKDMNHPRYVVARHSLFIKNVTEADNGFYTCRATVEADGRMDEKRIRVVVHVPPKIVKGIGETKGVEGHRVLLTCNATGFPRPKFKFLKDGRHVYSRDGYEINEDLASLSILSLKAEDKGLYTCKALNDAGEDQSMGQLRVLVRPKIFELENVTKTETEPATLVCRSHGNPPPQLSFRKDGTHVDYRLGNNDLDRIVLSQRNLHQLELKIKRLQPSDMAAYKCVAKNDVGVDEMSAYLNVRYKPRYHGDNFEVYGWAGGKHDMHCNVHANPPPIVQWIRYERFLENNMTYRITEDASGHTLTVHIRMDSDDENWIYGNYYCRAKNQIGEAQQRLKLNKATIPDPPTPKLLNMYSTMVVLGVSEPRYTGGIPITGYRVVMNKKQYDFNVEKTESTSKNDYVTTSFYSEGMRIENLNPNTDYFVKVGSKNLVGVSRMVNFTFRTYERTKPQQIVVVSPEVGSSAYQYNLVWQKPKTGGHPIKKYDIKYRKAANQNFLDQNAGMVDGSLRPGDWVHVTLWDDLYDPKVSYTISGLDPLSVYEVKIHAHNHAGRSDEGMLFRFRTTEVRLDSLSRATGKYRWQPLRIYFLLELLVLLLAAKYFY